ncbi:MAG: hypothetical protein ABIB79_01185 [archaeon]
MEKEGVGNKGQFYLLAAVIIVAIIIGFAAISNYSNREVSKKIYDLGEELGIESAKVLDYGTYNELSETNMTNLLTTFIEAYSEYGEIQKLYFIFGNADEINFYAYHQIEGEHEIVLSVGGQSGGTNASTFEVGEGSVESKDLTVSAKDIKTVTVVIGGQEYKFDLKPGENFYFIIVLTDEGEQFVYIGGSPSETFGG